MCELGMGYYELRIWVGEGIYFVKCCGIENLYYICISKYLKKEEKYEMKCD